MLNEKLAVLITRHLAGEASEEEQSELFELISKHPEQQYFLDLLENYWRAGDAISPDNETNNDEHFNHILALADEAEPDSEGQPNNSDGITSFRRKLYVWAAAAAACAAVAISTYRLSIKQPLPVVTIAHKNEISAKSGAKSRLTLPDGTKVWLNAESRIIYNNSFNSKSREVELDGEAFFDVVRNPQKPFIVHTSGIDIKVLGTAFNVKSYSKEATIEATLVRGLIEVIKKDEPTGPRVLLQPHEKLIFNKEKTSLKLAVPANAINRTPSQDIFIMPVSKSLPDSAMKETSWVYNKLIFDGDRFKDLAARMERWFDVKIVFKNDRVMEYRFKGVFENETIEQALNALQLTASFKYKIHDHEVEIY